MNEQNKFAHLEIPEDQCMTFGKLTLRPYQQAAFNAAVEHFKKSPLPAIISASVGAGKTVIIAALHAHVTDKGGAVLTLSRQGEIVEQDHDDAWLARCKSSIYSASLGKKTVAYPSVFGTEGTVWNALKADLEYWSAHCDSKTPFGDLSSEYLADMGIEIDQTKTYELSKMSNYSPALLCVDEAHMCDFTDPNCQYMKIFRELSRRNNKMRILGLTGTPYRGVTPIVGQADEYLWKEMLIDIPMEYLTDLGYLVPCTFGFAHDDVGYDLSEFESKGEDGTQDFTAEELRRMEALMLKAETTTEKIMIEVMARTKDRNCVMITCAGKKHCKEAAKFLPKGTYAIVTEDMGARLRKKALKDAFDGKIKYLLQVGCLTTGLNIPLIDTIVILRKIGSLTLLVQLIGRGLRLLKDFQIDAGIVKDDCLVLDYSDTMSELRELFDHPVLEEADLSKSKEDENTITCPKCQVENGKHAVRCRGIGSDGIRCDFFWRSRLCEPFFINGKLIDEGCGAENAPTARSCRCCDNTLIDPNAKLTGKHYTENDFIPVTKFDMRPTQNGGVAVEYHLVNGVVAKEFFPNAWDRSNPKHTIIKRMLNNNLIKKVFTKEHQAKAYRARNAGEFCQLLPLIKIEAVTHRKSGTKDIISKVMHKID